MRKPVTVTILLLALVLNYEVNFVSAATGGQSGRSLFPSDDFVIVCIFFPFSLFLFLVEISIAVETVEMVSRVISEKGKVEWSEATDE